MNLCGFGMGCAAGDAGKFGTRLDMELDNTIIYLIGIPAVGKYTVAKEIGRMSGARVVAEPERFVALISSVNESNRRNQGPVAELS